MRDLADFGLAAETIVNLFIIELGQLGDGDALQFGNLDVVDVGVFAQGLLVKLAAGVFFQLFYQGLASPFFRTDLETEQDVLVVVLEAAELVFVSVQIVRVFLQLLIFLDQQLLLPGQGFLLLLV
ncbi:hypothetical protein [Lactobacillus delbrueckii]|uniref:hypothetical protein n=1 Tax=Lactobacillus delbrueckii TaxID=1584 RepID=UPI001E635B21|nr:hypothetical protein [Lactobacillus delbrueckii]MCD5550434.1 hypothetical protein [Lactobacillus delbrueckii subsp. lactis]